MQDLDRDITPRLRSIQAIPTTPRSNSWARYIPISSAWILLSVSVASTAPWPASLLGAQAPQREVGRERRGIVETFRTDVPERPYDIVLGNPTDKSVTASVLAYWPTEGYIEFGPAAGATMRRGPPRFASSLGSRGS